MDRELGQAIFLGGKEGLRCLDPVHFRHTSKNHWIKKKKKGSLKIRSLYNASQGMLFPGRDI